MSTNHIESAFPRPADVSGQRSGMTLRDQAGLRGQDAFEVLEHHARAAERRAADAESERDRLRGAVEGMHRALRAIARQYDSPCESTALVRVLCEMAHEGLAHVYALTPWNFAPSAEPDTLPADSRFVEVEKPHPDSLRLQPIAAFGCAILRDLLQGEWEPDWEWQESRIELAQKHGLVGTRPADQEDDPEDYDFMWVNLAPEVQFPAMSAPSAKGETL